MHGVNEHNEIIAYLRSQGHAELADAISLYEHLL